MPEKTPKQPARKEQTGVTLQERTQERTKTQKPPLYRVLMHNDDYTTKEFVVWVLQTIFHRSEAESTAIMNHVHNQGVGTAGIYTLEVAETKVAKTLQLARHSEYPLQLTIEPTE